MPHRPHKHSLLLDECCAVKEYYPRINNFHRVQYIVADCKQTKLSDPEVYKYACNHGLLLITLNKKHFNKIVHKDGSGIIGVSGNMTPDQIDNKLSAFLRRHSSAQLKGQYFQLTNEDRTH